MNLQELRDAIEEAHEAYILLQEQHQKETGRYWQWIKLSPRYRKIERKDSTVEGKSWD